MAEEPGTDFDLDIDDFDEVHPMKDAPMCGVNNSCFDPGCAISCIS